MKKFNGFRGCLLPYPIVYDVFESIEGEPEERGGSTGRLYKSCNSKSK